MRGEPFTGPEETHEGWIGVPMTDPDEGEWGVDLRIGPGVLTAFVHRPVGGAGDERVGPVLAAVAERNGSDLGGVAE